MAGWGLRGPAIGVGGMSGCAAVAGALAGVVFVRRNWKIVRCCASERGGYKKVEGPVMDARVAGILGGQLYRRDYVLKDAWSRACNLG